MEQAQVLTFLNNKNRDLLLQFCGYSTTEPLHSFGPVVRPHYIIHFILNRKGIFQIREKTYHLETGQGFLIEPDELTFYQSDAQEPWEYLWIGFNGNLCLLRNIESRRELLELFLVINFITNLNKSSHFWDSKYTNRSKRSCCYWKDFSLCNVRS